MRLRLRKKQTHDQKKKLLHRSGYTEQHLGFGAVWYLPGIGITVAFLLIVGMDWYAKKENVG